MPSVSLCGLCPEIFAEENGSPECKSCLNISLYNDKKEKADAEMKEKIESFKKIEFPGPCEIRTNQTLGNYVVASRKIQEGELIFKEKAAFVAPSGDGDLIPYCIGCYKDIALSCKCSKCKWPVCDSSCENNILHANNECKIFADNNLRHKGYANEYFCIEVLRCLLARERFPERWAAVLKLEPHIETRKQDLKAVETLDIITHFIRNKCKLTEFDEEIIDRVVGVLSINTFWGFSYVNRYVTILFPKTSFIAHDCNPNTRRMIVKREITEEEAKDEDENGYEIEIHAKKTIEEGEMIAIHYGDMSKPVKERRAALKDAFYFDCCCERCLVELMEESNLSGDKSANNDTITNDL